MRERAAAYRDAAKVIFEGRVEKQVVKAGSVGPPEGALSMTPAGQYRVVTIRSSRVYRGPEQQVYTVITGMGTGDCGFDFETGNDYFGLC